MSTQSLTDHFYHFSVDPIKEAFAIVFEKELERLNTPDSYFPRIATELTKKRDFMITFLRSVGMKPIVPQGGYFLIADWSALGNYTFIVAPFLVHSKL